MFEKTYATIGAKTISHDLLCELHMAVLRFAIARNDEGLYKRTLERARALDNLSFDNTSQLEVYEAMYIMLFSPEKQSLQLLEAPRLT